MSRRTLLPLLLLAACSSQKPQEPCAAHGVTAALRFAAGSPDGHPDPMGAKAAGQARAGRVRDPSRIRQPDNAKEKVGVDDYLLVNDKIAVYIEGAGNSDAYLPFGGGILAVEPVGDDGSPLPVSQYGESLIGLSRQAVNPDTVTVLADGSDGGPAIVRASGVLKNIPFLDTFEAVSPDEFGFPAAIDYVLAPGAEKVTLRFSIGNTDAMPHDLATNQNLAFFHTFRNKIFTPGYGFGTAAGRTPWVGFDGGEVGFIVRMLKTDLGFVIEQSGFQLYQGQGLSVDACEQKTVDYAEVIVGSPGIDGAQAAMRRGDGDSTWRAITGAVAEPNGAGPTGVGGAAVHVLAADGRYLTRAIADAKGQYTVHAPLDAVTLVATHEGYAVPPPVAAAPGASAVPLQLGAHGTIAVHARDAATGEHLPVRVQVVPAAAVANPPDTFGVPTEINDRLYQAFSVDGEATLAVPPGAQRVIVTRGAEYELVDQMVQVQVGQTVDVAAALKHSVDSTGIMCADFHIHSFYSADAADPVEYKVRGAVADGLEIPVSSEHEWIVDFQPTIAELGLTKWAYGFPSEEFTTFTWGHFGIVPIQPRAGQLNNGAIDWIGKKPPEVFSTIAAHPENPVLIINHPSGGGFGAYFSSTHFNRQTAVGDPDMWSGEFEAVEVFNGSDLDGNRDRSVADWFALLNSGKTVWAVGNSDSHYLRSTPVGYPRTCFHFGHDDPTRLSPEAVRDQLRAGNAIVEGGLHMTVDGPGGAGPGATIAGGAGALEFHVVVQAPSWLSAQQLEVIVDGQTTQTIQLQELTGLPGPAHRYEAMVPVTPATTQARHWVVFHASTPGKDLAPLWPGRHPFAVSNPIFF